MKSLMKKCAAATLAVSSGIAPMASQLSGTVASRAGVAVATSAMVLLTPSVAHAQSGKRMCATVWGVRTSGQGGLASIGMEVSKYDLVTCTALVAGWVGLTALPSTVMAAAQSLFNNNVSTGTGLIGDLRMMQTCEAFSRSMQANTGNVCLQMTDYRLYTFVKVYGGRFSMGRT